MKTTKADLRYVVFSPFQYGPTFALKVWDCNKRDSLGKHVLGYRLTQFGPGVDRQNWQSEILFEGEDFCCSPCHAVDSNETIEQIMGFLTLRPGDTDSEYFDNYTPRQMEFCEQYAEYLACAVMAWFEGENEE